MNSRTEARLPECGLFLVTLATVLGFSRLFTGGTRTLVPLIFTAILVHVCASLTRRFTGRAAGALMLVAGVVTAVELSVAHTTVAGIPTLTTWHVGINDVSTAIHRVAMVQAPTRPIGGFMIVAILAIWVVGWLADRLAFKLGAPIEALAPAATLFVFQTLLATQDHFLVHSALFAMALLIYGLVLRWSRLQHEQPPLVPDHPIRLASLGMGTALAGLTVLVAMTLVQAVPGFTGTGIIDVRNRKNASPARAVESPLVNIKGQLNDQSDIPLFGVTSNHAALWRLMSLDDFDGTVWSSDQKFSDAKGNLGGRPFGQVPTTPINAKFGLTGLVGTWAPAAMQATSVTGTADLQWSENSAALIVDKKRGTVEGLDYQVTSRYPDVTAQTISSTHGLVPKTIKTTDTHLPTDFPPDLTALAEKITVDESTTLGKARALQDYFLHTGGFTYSLDAPSGQSTNAIEAFLETRSGYCEQFAGTFAALARAIGLPTRVVVGFTTGESTGTGAYQVFAFNAHAWDEVYFAGIGWLSFDPTPGRGDPNAVSYSGITNPGQASPIDHSASVTSTTLAPPVTTPSAAAPATTVPAAQAPSAPSKLPVVAAPPRSARGPNPWIGGLALAAGVVALCAALLLFSARRNERRRRVRRDHARSPAEEVLVAWTEVVEAWTASHVVRRSAETHKDFGDRLELHLTAVPTPAVPSDSARRLAELSTIAAWQGAAIGADQAEQARLAAFALCDAASRELTRFKRFMLRVDPRQPSARYRHMRRHSSR